MPAHDVCRDQKRPSSHSSVYGNPGCLAGFIVNRWNFAIADCEQRLLAPDIGEVFDAAPGAGRCTLSSDEDRKVERFRKYAGELRALADKVVSPAAKMLILRVVADYERMANMLEGLVER